MAVFFPRREKRRRRGAGFYRQTTGPCGHVGLEVPVGTTKKCLLDAWRESSGERSRVVMWIWSH